MQLINREAARQIRHLARDTNQPEVVLDFSQVSWTSRSFMDEFVEELINNPPYT